MKGMNWNLYIHHGGLDHRGYEEAGGIGEETLRKRWVQAMIR